MTGTEDPTNPSGGTDLALSRIVALTLGGQMSLSVQDATQLDWLTGAVIAATEAEMCTAAYVLARATRDAHPTAATMLLDESDQGDWLSVQGWRDSVGANHDLLLDEEAANAALHLYTANLGADDNVSVVPGLCCTDRRRGLYCLDVDQVLSSPTIRMALPLGLGARRAGPAVP